MANEFLAGVEMGGGMVSRARGEALREAEFRQQQALMPLQMQQMEQGLRARALQIEISQHAQKIELNKLEGARALAQTMAETPPSDPNYLNKINRIGIEHPEVLDSPAYNSAVSQWDKSNKLAIQLREEQNKATALGLRVQAAEISAGLQAGRMGLMQERLELEREKAERGGTPSTAMKEINEINAAKNTLQGLMDNFQAMKPDDPNRAGLQRKIRDTQSTIQMLETKFKGQQISLTTTSPSGESSTINIGAGGTAPGVAAQIGGSERGKGTMVAKKIAPLETTMELINLIEPDLNSKNIGPVGGTKAAVGNTLGAFIPPLTPHKANELAANVVYLREKLAREIPEGGRETQAARRDILEALPKTGIFLNPTKQRDLLNAARRYARIQAENYAEEVGRTPLVGMTLEEMDKFNNEFITNLNKQKQLGLITDQEAFDQAQALFNRISEAKLKYGGQP